MHISIMVNEILDFLKIQPGETGFDATLGYGGHTKAMLQCLNGQGHIYATDVDPVESEKTKKRLADQGFGEDILTVRLQNFCTIDEIAKEVGGFDFILADLGVSSMQIDNPERGFSFKTEGPLDLRLNQQSGISAAERLDTISRDELAGMLYENSDEPYSEELAKAITDEIRKGNRIDTTTKLRQHGIIGPEGLRSGEIYAYAVLRDSIVEGGDVLGRTRTFYSSATEHVLDQMPHLSIS